MFHVDSTDLSTHALVYETKSTAKRLKVLLRDERDPTAPRILFSAHYRDPVIAAKNFVSLGRLQSRLVCVLEFDGHAYSIIRGGALKTRNFVDSKPTLSASTMEDGIYVDRAVAAVRRVYHYMTTNPTQVSLWDLNASIL